MMIDYGKELQKAYDDGYKDRDAEIVRCKDCKHYQAYTEFGVKKEYGFCVVQGMSPRVDDWFCADGERKCDDKDD